MSYYTDLKTKKKVVGAKSVGTRNYTKNSLKRKFFCIKDGIHSEERMLHRLIMKVFYKIFGLIKKESRNSKLSLLILSSIIG